jgi:hypothetical protein
MKFQRVHTRVHPTERSSQPRKWALWLGVLAGLAGIAIVPVVGEGRLQQGPPSPPPNPPGVTPHQVYPTPDAKGMSDGDPEQTRQENYEAANAERKRQIADESTKLLKLATELKVEVDKTTKDTLSLNVIHKAEEIEKLAHSVKETMKLSVRAN